MVTISNVQQPATKQILLTVRSEYVDDLDRLVASWAAANRSELVDKIVGGFIADLRNRQTPQNQQSALGNFIAFLLIVVGIAAIIKALGERD